MSRDALVRILFSYIIYGMGHIFYFIQYIIWDENDRSGAVRSLLTQQ